MKTKHLRPFLYLAVAFLSLGYFAPPTSAQKEFSVALPSVSFQYTKIEMSYREAAVQRGDGSVFTAEVVAEFVLFEDGRANGGFGMWGLAGPNVLSLYRVTEGRNNGPYWSFKATRLAAEPADQITIEARVGGGLVPQGSVTFVIHGTSGLHLTFSVPALVNDGCSGGRCTDPPPTFGLVHADPQTVLVETFTGNYTASFENVALVLSKGRAIGSLVLSSPNGSLQRIRIKGGEIDFHNGNVSWLRGQTTGSNADSSLVLIVIKDGPRPSEPCRIYDIAGTQVHAYFEAESRITALTVDPD
jgi:hypothetical protein